MADVLSQYKEAERIYILDKHLLENKVIGLQEFKKAENDYNYYLEKKKLTQQILLQDSLSRAQQLEQDKRSYQGSQETLNMMKQKVNDLIVKSPIQGQLTSLDAEIGENKRQGDRLGQNSKAIDYCRRLTDFFHHFVRVQVKISFMRHG